MRRRKVPLSLLGAFSLLVDSTIAQDTTPLDPFDTETPHQCHQHLADSTQTIEIAPDLSFTILQDSGQFLEGTEGDATGTIIWTASLCLSKYVYSGIQFDDGDTVLELGSGVGLPSLVVAQKIQSSHSGNNNMIRIIATDREEATLHQLEAVAKLNGLDAYLTPRQLDWNTRDGGNLLMGQQVDVILAADVVYHEKMVDPLVGIIGRLLKMGGTVYLALNNTRRGRKYFVEEAMPKGGFELFQAIPCALRDDTVTIYVFQKARPAKKSKK